MRSWELPAHVRERSEAAESGECGKVPILENRDVPSPSDFELIDRVRFPPNHDGRGDMVETVTPGGPPTETQYDGAGRVTSHLDICSAIDVCSMPRWQPTQWYSRIVH